MGAVCPDRGANASCSKPGMSDLIISLIMSYLDNDNLDKDNDKIT